jgi:hypothetical protein
MILDIEKTIGSSLTNEDGSKLFDYMKNAYNSNTIIVIQISPIMTMTSSFLNTSIGQFIDIYGPEEFKKTVKLKSSRVQYERIVDYIKKYMTILVK